MLTRLMSGWGQPEDLLKQKLQLYRESADTSFIHSCLKATGAKRQREIFRLVQSTTSQAAWECIITADAHPAHASDASVTKKCSLLHETPPQLVDSARGVTLAWSL